MRITEVSNRRQFRQFLDVPRILHAADPNFISPLDTDLEKILTSKNHRLQEGGLKMWIAYNESGVVTGRVAAFFENEKKEEGGLGFFESIDNQEVANTLFDAACRFLRENGKDRALGPVNFGERDKFWGLLVKGFRPPMYQENYNPPYYQNLFESYGFTPKFTQTTFEIRPEYFNRERIQRLAAQIDESDEYRVEHFKKHSLETYAADFAKIYNASWAEYEHFEPLTRERVVALMESMEHVIREDLIWFTYHRDRPVAFYVNVIDVNQILKHLNGKMNLWGMFKFLWYKRTTKIDRIKGLVFGVIPEYQGKGLYAAMIMRMYHIVVNDPHLKCSELSWIGDFNPRMKNLLLRIGARESKVHNTYGIDTGRS